MGAAGHYWFCLHCILLKTQTDKNWHYFIFIETHNFILHEEIELALAILFKIAEINKQQRVSEAELLKLKDVNGQEWYDKELKRIKAIYDTQRQNEEKRK